MGNGLFLRLSEVFPESEVLKNLRLRKAVLSQPHHQALTCRLCFLWAVDRFDHFVTSRAAPPVTLLHPLPLVLNTFLMDTVSFKVYSEVMEFGSF